MTVRQGSALALAVGCLGACGGTGVGAVDGPVLTSPAGRADSGMAALVLGTVDIRDGCVLLVQEDVPGGATAPAYPVIWPAGTTLAGGPSRRHSRGRSGRGTGDVGQWRWRLPHAGQHREPSRAAVADAADECTGATGEIAFFNIGSDVEVG